MKLINKNNYKIMYGMEFFNSEEVKEFDNETAKKLLAHPGIEEYADVKQVKNLEEENTKLKAELELTKLKEQAKALNIKFNPNIGIEKLKEKIAKAQEG